MLRKTSFLALAMACMLRAGTAQAIPIELAVNGGFETGDFTGWTQFTNGGTQEVIGLSFDGDYSARIDQRTVNNSLIKNANIGVGLVKADDLVTISFAVTGLGLNGGVILAEFFSEVAGGGFSKSEILGGGPIRGSGEFVVYDFTAIAGPDVTGGVTLQLGVVCGAVPDCFSLAAFDNVSVSIPTPPSMGVPEPATATLLLLGVFGLRWSRRKKV